MLYPPLCEAMTRSASVRGKQRCFPPSLKADASFVEAGDTGASMRGHDEEPPLSEAHKVASMEAAKAFRLG